jgi:hypothetical protein
VQNDQLREILDGIAAKSSNGLLVEEDIVEEARPKDSPLHSEFEWDNREAAEQYRLMQANMLIRRVYVTITTPNMVESVRAYVSLGNDRVSGGGYRRMVDVMTDVEQQKELLKTALAELQNFQRRYQSLTALFGVFEEIKRVVSRKSRQKAENEARV